MLGTLYSFRRCPYAMRARLALTLCLPESSLELREVVLKNKPQAMLDISPKATVPVLLLSDGKVIDESIDIMHWALGQNTRLLADLYPLHLKDVTDQLIAENDGDFKWALDRYKYSDRYEYDEHYYQEKARVFLIKLEQCLIENNYLLGDSITLADLAIFPFVRQFAHVNKSWFEQKKEYTHLNAWLGEWLETDLFTSIMKKYTAWAPSSESVYFP